MKGNKMPRSKFRSKVKSAAVKYLPDDVSIHAFRYDGRWFATISGLGHETNVEANGLMDLMSKACEAWHKLAGTNLAKIVREAEKNSS